MKQAMDTEKLTMNINIAGETLALTVPYEQQEHVRATEKAVDNLFKEWSERFRNKSPQFILAMIAYQYASHFLSVCDVHESAIKVLEELEEQIDDAMMQPKVLD